MSIVGRNHASIKLALVWQLSTQSIIRRMWDGSALVTALLQAVGDGVEAHAVAIGGSSEVHCCISSFMLCNLSV